MAPSATPQSSLLMILWALVLVGVAIIQPPIEGPILWLLLIPAIVIGVAYILVWDRDHATEADEAGEWRVRVRSLADHLDFRDDGRLFECLSSVERERILSELVKMPKGSRSLSRAVQAVCPELLREK